MRRPILIALGLALLSVSAYTATQAVVSIRAVAKPAQRQAEETQPKPEPMRQIFSIDQTNPILSVSPLGEIGIATMATINSVKLDMTFEFFVEIYRLDTVDGKVTSENVVSRRYPPFQLAKGTEDDFPFVDKIPDLPPGKYQVAVGLNNLESGRRFSLRSGQVTIK